jgi:hypothetical protein
MELGSSGNFFSFGMEFFFSLNIFMMDQGFLQGMAVERTWSSARGGVRSGILLGLAPCSSHMYIVFRSLRFHGSCLPHLTGYGPTLAPEFFLT